MSARSDVLLWAQRVIARKGQPAHVLLELRADAGADEAQAAFHKIARTSHPDLHRSGLTPDELEMVTSAYAAVAGAYQELRTKTMATTRMQPLRRDDAPSPAKPPTGDAPATASSRPPAAAPTQPAVPGAAAQARPKTPTAAPTTTPPGPVPSAMPTGTKAEQAMSQKAVLYYRKAELALKRGDLRGAVLQLKLACATDPSSAFLKSALAQVETEVKKTT